MTSADAERVAEEHIAQQVGRDAARKGERARRRELVEGVACRLVDCGGDGDDAEQDQEVAVAEGVDREPRPPLEGRLAERALRPLVVAAEVRPPEAG